MSLIPKRIDDPPKVLFWELDQALVFLVCSVLGIAFGAMFSASILGLILAYAYGKSKGGKHRGYARHLLYWHTPFSFGMRRTPPSSIRCFRG